MDNDRMRNALVNIGRIVHAYRGHPFDLIHDELEKASMPIHTTSDAVRRIKELTGTSFENALQAYQEGETVEAAVQLIEVWRKRHA